MKTIVDWIFANNIELIGSALGIAYVLLASKQNIWCWLLGIISCALYIIVFFMARLYGDMTLQVFYLLLGIYGWFVWFKKTTTVKLNIDTVKKGVLIWLIISIGVMSLLFGYLLSFTDDPIPYWDGFTNALGLAATWMTARKYLENWLLWIFTNFICVGVYAYKELYPTMVFYFIMAILAYRAFLIWKKELILIQND